MKGREEKKVRGGRGGEGGQKGEKRTRKQRKQRKRLKIILVCFEKYGEKIEKETERKIRNIYFWKYLNKKIKMRWWWCNGGDGVMVVIV